MCAAEGMLANVAAAILGRGAVHLGPRLRRTAINARRGSPIVPKISHRAPARVSVPASLYFPARMKGARHGYRRREYVYIQTYTGRVPYRRADEGAEQFAT